MFWAVGVRLMLAGLRQIVNPEFTAATIFGVKEKAALTIVQELGFANVAIGLLGALTLLNRQWIAPAEIFGLRRWTRSTPDKGDRNATENIAMISDLFIATRPCGGSGFRRRQLTKTRETGRYSHRHRRRAHR